MITAEAIRQPRGAFAALTSRSYRIYLGGQSLANTGTWMQSIAQDWLVYDLTHSSTCVGVTTFHGNASTYGLFNIALAIGSAAGALFAGAAAHPRPRMLVLSAAAFGLLQVAAAVAADLAMFLVLLGALGLVNLAFQSMANASVQLAVDSRLRGRVMGLYMLAFIGGTPIGAPLIGALTSQFGARVGMTICGVVPTLAAVVVATAAARRRRAEASAAHVKAGHLRPGVTS